MINSMHIENFKCFREFRIGLGNFNVLIGPNDSGKTAFLQAIGLASFQGCRTVGIPCDHIPVPVRNLGDELVWEQRDGLTVRIGITASATVQGDDVLRVVFVRGRGYGSEFRMETSPGERTPTEKLFGDAVGVVQYYRFNPAVMKEDSQEKAPFATDGKGLPTFLSDLLREDRDAFQIMEQDFRKRFPEYRIKLPRVHANDNGLVFAQREKGEWELSADSISDGAVLYLAFLALSQRPNPPRILLIEEPENGVHHAALEGIVKVLKAISEEKGVQLIVSTHSPYLLDFVDPGNVYVFRKGEDGAVGARQLSDFPDVEQMRKHFMTGEIWSTLAEPERI